MPKKYLPLIPEEVIKDARGVFDYHKTILEHQYDLDLENYRFESIEKLYEEGREKSKNSIYRFLYQLVLKAAVFHLRNYRMAIYIRKRIIYVNPDDFKESAEWYMAGLTYTVIHECFHTLVPSVDPQGQYVYVKVPSKDELNIKTFFKCIKDLIRYRMHKRIEEAVADFCAIQYLREYCEKESEKIQSKREYLIREYKKKFEKFLSKIKQENITTNVRANEISSLKRIDNEISSLENQLLRRLQDYCKIRERKCIKSRDRSLPYIRLQQLFETRGYEGIKEGIKNPSLLLSRSS